MYQKRQEWLQILQLVDTSGLQSVLGPCIGFATDGDPRCRGIMVEEMFIPAVLDARAAAEPDLQCPDELYVAIDDPTFVFCGRLHSWSNGVTSLTGAHMQDYLHSTCLCSGRACHVMLSLLTTSDLPFLAVFVCVVSVGKRQYNGLDKDAKFFVLGNQLATMSSLRCLLGHILDKGLVGQVILRMIDIMTPRPNRMDTSGILRATDPAVESAFMSMPEYKKLYVGITVYLRWCRRFLALFNGGLDIQELVTTGGYVVFFMRIWHTWLSRTEHKATRPGDAQTTAFTSVSLDKNGLPVQTRTDIEIAVHSIINVVVWCGRNGLSPIDPSLAGSDVVEWLW